jgi:hypothetical protein
MCNHEDNTYKLHVLYMTLSLLKRQMRCTVKHSLQPLHRAEQQIQDMQLLLLTTLLICNYCAFTMAWSLAG